MNVRKYYKAEVTLKLLQVAFFYTEADWTQQVKVTPPIAKEQAPDLSPGLTKFFPSICQFVNIWLLQFKK